MGVTNFIFRHTQVLYSWLMLVSYQPLYPHKNGWLCTPPLLSHQCVILLVKSHSYRGYPLVIKNSFRTGQSLLFSIGKSSFLSIYYNLLYCNSYCNTILYYTILYYTILYYTMLIYYTSICNIAMYLSMIYPSAVQLPISTGATAAPWPKWLANASQGKRREKMVDDVWIG